MNILVFGGSTSTTSINQQLAVYAAGLHPDAELTVLELHRLSLPIYQADLEISDGIPADATRFLELIRAHDAIIVSLAEHNGTYAAAFKNLYDWISRIDNEPWSGKAMLLMATSPGERGGASVLEAAEATFSRRGANIRATFSLPSFYENFDTEKGLTNPELANELQAAVMAL